MKRRFLEIVVMVCVCFLFVSVYMYKGSNNKSMQNKVEAVCDHLSRRIVDDFTNIDGIISANAIVNYDKSQEQYSIELSLVTDKDVNKEQVELHKSVLRKTYVDVKLTINGILR